MLRPSRKEGERHDRPKRTRGLESSDRSLQGRRARVPACRGACVGPGREVALPRHCVAARAVRGGPAAVRPAARRRERARRDRRGRAAPHLDRPAERGLPQRRDRHRPGGRAGRDVLARRVRDRARRPAAADRARPRRNAVCRAAEDGRTSPRARGVVTEVWRPPCCSIPPISGCTSRIRSSSGRRRSATTSTPSSGSRMPGGAAVVLHSLFEEQVGMAREGRIAHMNPDDQRFAEMIEYFPKRSDFCFGPEEYAEHLYRVTRAVKIPVIGSLNGHTRESWLTYAPMIEQAGAPPLEGNLYEGETGTRASAGDGQGGLLEVGGDIKARLKIPLAGKSSPCFPAV